MRRFSFTAKIVLLAAFPQVLFFALIAGIQVDGIDKLSQNAAAITGNGLQAIYNSHLESRSKDIAEKVALKINSVRNELKIIAGAAQNLADRNDLHDLGKSLQDNGFLKNIFQYNADNHWSNLVPNDAGISMSVWGYLHNPDGTINQETLDYVTMMTPMKMILNGVGKHGQDKGWLYVTGPKSSPVMMMTPWEQMPAIFDKKYPGHNTENWWDFFFPGIIEGWEKWRQPGISPPVAGDEVTLTPLYDDAGGTGLMVTFFAPLWSQDRRTNWGAAALDYNVDTLVDIVRGERVGRSGGAFLMQSDGNALGLESGLASLLGLTAKVKDDQGVRQTFFSLGESRFEDLHRYPEWLKGGGFSLHAIRGKDGARYLLSLQSVTDFNLWTGNGPQIVRDSLYLGLIVPEDEFLHVSYAMQEEIARVSEGTLRSTIAMSVILVLVTVTAAAVYAVRETKQIRLMSAGVAALRERRFDVSVDVVSGDDLGDLARTFNGMIRELKASYSKLQDYAHTLEEKVRDRTQHLAEVNQELERLSQLDGLTRLFNRRSLESRLERLWREHADARLPLSVIMVDVDHFKKYNDAYGHLAGDDCLRQVASALQAIVRHPTDLLARYGGEEFVAVLSGKAEEAQKVAERMRQAVEALALPHCDADKGLVSISLGFATAVPLPAMDVVDLIKAADEALYSSKRAGRDRVSGVVLAPSEG